MTKRSLMGVVVALSVLMLAGPGCEGPQVVPDDTMGEEQPAMSYPASRRTDTKDVIFGVEVQDPYRWLEDVEQPEVVQWMDDQDALARDYLANVPSRDGLAKRLEELFYVDAISAPSRRGEIFFYSRRHADKEKRIHYWRKGDGPEKVLLDPNTMGNGENTSVGVVRPTWDGTRVAYTLRENNADEATLYVMTVETGEVSKVDVIEGAKYAYPSWDPKGQGFYYTFLPTDPSIPVAERPGYADLRYHKLGTSPSADVILRAKLGDPELFVDIEITRDGRWLFAYTHHGWNATDIHYRDLKKGDKKWKELVVGIDAEFRVDAYKGKLYIWTKHEAPRGKIYVASADAPQRDKWTTLVDEDPAVVLDNYQIIGGHLVLTTLKNAASEIQIRSLDGKLVRNVAFPAIGASYGMTGLPEDDDAYFGFESMTLPPRIFKTSIKTGESELWAEVKVPIKSDDYVLEQVWYPSKDGTKVSMFVVHHKDLVKDGKTPLLLYGYGGFNVNMRPRFRASVFPWLEAGGIYAMPNLRGGGEYGEQWHRAGMLLNKQNVFDDFIAAAEYLQKEGYTSADRMAIRGGSNGGLLVGAAMTQRPDLFKAVICHVPLLDMVRYHLFGSGKTWIAEYGSADDEKEFAVLHGYSPYHRVKEGTDYPGLLMLSADHDDRVDPMHARKMTAAIQHATTGTRPILLRVEKNAGHGGADLVKQSVQESADVYAFLTRELGMLP